MLQSDGDKLHESDVPALKMEEIEGQTVEKERTRRQIIKIRLRPQSFFKLMSIFTEFLKTKLNQTGFGGAAGGSRVLMQKLYLANQMCSIQELAGQHLFGEKKSDKLTLTAFQRTLMSTDIAHSAIQDQLNQVFDWLLG